MRKAGPVPGAVKIPDVKAAVHKEWNKLEKMPVWQVTNVKSKKEVIEKAQKKEDSPFCDTDVLAKVLKIQRARRGPMCCGERRVWVLRCVHRAGIVSITK